MTEITPGEIKLIYLQIILMAIVGIFIFLYSQAPITQSYDINSQATSATSVNKDDASWLSGLMSEDAGLGGLLPNGAAELLIVSSIFLIPLTIMNSIVVIRYLLDVAKGWI